MINILINILLFIAGISSFIGVSLIILDKIAKRNNKKILKTLKEATTIEEVNIIIEEEIGITELPRKIKFLQENFEIQMVGHSPQTENDYICMLNAIIKNKYR